MKREHIRATFEKINEAHEQWKTEQGKMRAEADRVLTRLLHECLAKRMSPEHIAEMSGWHVKDVRSAMRARGIDPKTGKGVLAKSSASALIDNANLLGIEPEQMDLTSPLAYLPMGESLREFLETNPVQPVQSVLAEGWYCTSCQTYEYDDEPASQCHTCGCAGSAHVETKIIAEGQVEA